MSFTNYYLFLPKSSTWRFSTLVCPLGESWVSFLELLHDLFSTSTWNKLGQTLGLAHWLVPWWLVQPVYTTRSIASLIETPVPSVILFLTTGKRTIKIWTLLETLFQKVLHYLLQVFILNDSTIKHWLME